MIILKEVDRHNIDAVLALKVAEGQQDYVAPNVESMAQAKVMPECVPLAVYDGDELVGFLMYAMDEDDHEYWVYRLMVDEKHQRKGYGRATMQALLAVLKKDAAHHKLYLGVEPENEGGVGLYKSLGFDFEGRVYGKEKVMLLEYQ